MATFLWAKSVLRRHPGPGYDRISRLQSASTLIGPPGQPPAELLQFPQV